MASAIIIDIIINDNVLIANRFIVQLKNDS